MFKFRKSRHLPVDEASSADAPIIAPEAAHFNEASAWDIDRILLIKRSERRAWQFMLLFAGIAAASMVAIVLLMPLKTVEPFVIRVDNSTGIVDIVNTLRTSKNTYDEAISKYFLARYLRAKEGYSPATFALAYSEAGYLSSAPMRDALYAEFNPQNPNSPVNVNGSSDVSIQIKTVSFLKDDLASIRYLKRSTSNNVLPSHWVANG